MDRLSWPLVGRELQLAHAARLLTQRAAGGVVVSGEPGVGKTRLAHEIAELAAASGYAVAWVRATRSAQAIGLGAFAALLPPLEGAVTGVAELLARARHAVVGGRRRQPDAVVRRRRAVARRRVGGARAPARQRR